MSLCKYCGHPSGSPYKGVSHASCYRQHKRLEWKKADATTKKEIEKDMSFLSLIERTFT